MKCSIGLAFNRQHNKVLLQMKRRGPEFNIGFLNPPGGKLEEGETPLDCMVREFAEETGLYTVDSQWLQFHYERHQSGTELWCYTTDEVNLIHAENTTNEPNVIVELGRTLKGWVNPAGYVWCPYADGISPSPKEYAERIEVQTAKPRGGLAYNMPWMIPMALTFLEHPEHRYLEG